MSKDGPSIGKASTAGGGAAAILAAAWTNSTNEDVSAFLEAAGFMLIGVWLTMLVVDWWISTKHRKDDEEQQ